MASKPRVYFESCPFIDAAKFELGSATKDDDGNEAGFFRLLLEAAFDGELEGFTSALTIVECLHTGPVGSKPTEEAKRVFESLLCSGRFVALIGIDAFTAKAARDLRWNDGIIIGGKGGPRDYLHLAAAIYAKCDEFITTDRRILAHAGMLLAKGLRVVRPSGTTCLSVERRQLLLPTIPSKGKVISLVPGKRRRKPT